MTHLLLVPVLLFGADPSVVERFSEVLLDKTYERCFLANPLLMESAGVKAIRLPTGHSLVLVTASTALADNSARERLRAETVCRTKALAYFVQEQAGVRVYRSVKSAEETILVNSDGVETGKNIVQILEITEAKAQGIVRSMPVVGRWKSKEGDVFYLALGAVFDQAGNIVPNEL